MLPGDYATVQADVTGGRKIQYAKRGDKVRVIFISIPAVVVEDKKHRRFPTTLDNLIKTPAPAGAPANKQ